MKRRDNEMLGFLLDRKAREGCVWSLTVAKDSDHIIAHCEACCCTMEAHLSYSAAALDDVAFSELERVLAKIEEAAIEGRDERHKARAEAKEAMLAKLSSMGPIIIAKIGTYDSATDGPNPFLPAIRDTAHAFTLDLDEVTKRMRAAAEGRPKC